jgi:hypothetical protein
MQPSKLPDGKARACLVEACRTRWHGVILGVIAKHHVQGATVREDPDTRFFTATARPPTTHHRSPRDRQGGRPERALAPPYQGSYEKSRPWPVFDHSRVASHGSERDGGDPHIPRGRTYLQKGPSICHRITIDAHHRQRFHPTRTSLIRQLSPSRLAGRLSIAVQGVYVAFAERTIERNWPNSSVTGKNKIIR